LARIWRKRFMRKSKKLNGEDATLKNENTEKFQLKGKVIFFVSGNVHKYLEVRSLLGPTGLAVGWLRMKGAEIQSDGIVEIAKASATEAFKRCNLPLIVEDAGLFIDALDGFPGPYAAYVYKTLHNRGILKLMEGVKNRDATFRSTIAYCETETAEPVVFEGESKGQITQTEREEAGKSGFGFDPIFQPNGSKKSFAEMTIEEKNGFSHRAMSVRKFAKWYLGDKIVF
jgi:XTP/dITP diphosphohydrolase